MNETDSRGLQSQALRPRCGRTHLPPKANLCEKYPFGGGRLFNFDLEMMLRS
jgi:hypothetical protein